MDQVLTSISDYLAKYGLNIVGALIIFFVGRWLAGFLSSLVEKALVKAKVDKTIASFARHLTHIGLLVFVVISALSRLGIETAQFAVVIGAAGLAIGLAWQGTLSNFASGVLLIIFRPFRVGDFIEAAGVKGTVTEIQIFTTIINTPDNIRVIIPNSHLTGGNIMNYTANGTRRVDLSVGVSYGDDLKKTRQVIERVLASDQRILADPAPAVAVSALGDSSVNFVVRPWVKAGDYWDVYFELTAKIKLALDENGIVIPFPQRDVHIKNEVVQASRTA